MTASLKLDEKYLSIVLGIITRHLPDTEIWAFGSRVNGSARKYSDLDLLLDNSEIISDEVLGTIKEELSESDLPIKVDVLDRNSLDKEFLEIIEKEKTLIQG